MTVRVSDAEVKEILNTDITDTSTFITAANVVINNELSDEITAGDVDTDTLKEMERWLAAHFASAWDQQAVELALGEARVKYQGQFGKGLESTTYGQRALLLDPTGRLVGGGRKTAKFKSIDFLS